MATYYVNKNEQKNGDHEVHTDGCKYLPLLANRIDLGDFTTCQAAVREAKKHYVKVNGCKTCLEPCHTQ